MCETTRRRDHPTADRRSGGGRVDWRITATRETTRTT